MWATIKGLVKLALILTVAGLQNISVKPVCFLSIKRDINSSKQITQLWCLCKLP